VHVHSFVGSEESTTTVWTEGKRLLSFTPEKNMDSREWISATFVRIGLFCHFSECNEVEVSF
jgi:hypothetical protein